MSFIEFLQSLGNPVLAFLPKALLVAAISSVICGIVGVHVVLRGMSFVGDALAHAVFPGIAVAFALQISILLGGAVAGVTVAVLISLFSQNRRMKEDSLIGVFFAAAFALGLVIMSQIPGYTGSLESFLFGSITGVSNTDILTVAIASAVVLTLLFLFHKELVSVSLDRESARAGRLPVAWLDLLLYMTVAVAVVISVRTIGNILVLALLITPATTARLLTDRLGMMMVIGPLIGFFGAFIGIYLSWAWGVPTGACIVLVLTAVFVLAWLFAPRRGLVMSKRAAAHTHHPTGATPSAPSTPAATATA